MSNRIDFFQSSKTQPAIPAASVSIVIDGMLCPELEPVEIIRSGWPEFSLARLAFNPAAYPDSGITTGNISDRKYKPISNRVEQGFTLVDVGLNP